ncbi:MAG: hypothetical protein K9H25_02505 [Rhodospirillum sp.]|nr:hypothetical protein [Rhodospirillum sp.]MCF8488001.1 hypothetical protein [Rhodospirillum sp.]MCF8500474.1 hypothetical protein [Rhodospirillum sp.]
MGLIDSLWNKLLGDPKKPGGNKPHVKAAARDAALGKRKSAPSKAATKALAKAKAGAGAGASLPAPRDSRAEAEATIRANQTRLMTPEREQLISNALAVHRAKQKILADLSDEDRRKLMVTAMRALLNEGKEQEK